MPFPHRTSNAPSRLGQLFRPTVIGAWTALVIFVDFRRLQGAFDFAPSATACWAAAGLLLLLGVARTRDGWPEGVNRSDKRDLFRTAIFSATVLAFGLGLTFTTPTSLFIWLIVILEETWVWRDQLRRLPAVGFAAAEMANSIVAPADQRLTQQLERGTSADGTEFIRARLRGRFQPRDRNLHLHVGFCPPLTRIPSVAVEQLEGPPIQIQVGHCQIYGVRLDLRLTSAEATGDDVLLTVMAREPGLLPP